MSVFHNMSGLRNAFKVAKSQVGKYAIERTDFKHEKLAIEIARAIKAHLITCEVIDNCNFLDGQNPALEFITVYRLTDVGLLHINEP